MTHDELLANIDYAIEEYDKYSRPYFYALCAVVELHKPMTHNNIVLCQECECLYPCPTIRAIKGELA